MRTSDEWFPEGESAGAWFAGGGEMGARIRRHVWASTPLGPTAGWPQSLRSAIRFLLPSKAQICLFWGPELVKLYNDAYIPVLGRKHPDVLGRPGAEVWSEIWDVLGPLLEGVVATGEAFRAGDHPFFVERHGFTEVLLARPRARVRRSRDVGEDRLQPPVQRVQVHLRRHDRGRAR